MATKVFTVHTKVSLIIIMKPISLFVVLEWALRFIHIKFTPQYLVTMLKTAVAGLERLFIEGQFPLSAYLVVCSL